MKSNTSRGKLTNSYKDDAFDSNDDENHYSIDDECLSMQSIDDCGFTGFGNPPAHTALPGILVSHTSDKKQKDAFTESDDDSMMSMQTIDGFSPSIIDYNHDTSVKAPGITKNHTLTDYKNMLSNGSMGSLSSESFNDSDMASSIENMQLPESAQLPQKSPVKEQVPATVVNSMWDNVIPVVGQTSKLNLFEDESRNTIFSDNQATTSSTGTSFVKKPSVIYTLPTSMFNKVAVTELRKKKM